MVGYLPVWIREAKVSRDMANFDFFIQISWLGAPLCKQAQVTLSQRDSALSGT
jgi:hypothetical protein